MQAYGALDFCGRLESLLLCVGDEELLELCCGCGNHLWRLRILP